MPTIRLAACILVGVLLAACGTVEDSAWWNRGVAPEKAKEIRRAFVRSHPNCKVYQYHLDDYGSIELSTECGIWKAKRVEGSWRFEEVLVIT